RPHDAHDDASVASGPRGGLGGCPRRGVRGGAGPTSRSAGARRRLRAALACPAAGRRAGPRMSVREHDDEVLGKAYDARLMARLWQVTRPHGRLVALSLLVFPGVTLLELLQPYLVKIAIDDHILRGDWVGLGPVAALFLVVLGGLYGLR